MQDKCSLVEECVTLEFYYYLYACFFGRRRACHVMAYMEHGVVVHITNS